MFKYTDAGIEVHPSPRAKLPGIFQNQLQAERALEKYMAECRVAAAERESKKRGAKNG
jgi:hypothetical protein